METQIETEAARQEKIDESMEKETHGRLEKMLLIYLIDYYFRMFSQNLDIPFKTPTFSLTYTPKTNVMYILIDSFVSCTYSSVSVIKHY